MEKSKVLKKLSEIQAELKVPKSQRNTFGKYNFRSAEDILESLKPLLKEKGVTIIITEELKLIQEHIYVSSTSALFDIESGEEIAVEAAAIIDLNAKGMQKPQQTGAASSYAKKYALGNLLLLDDTKDPDSTNVHTGDEKKSTTRSTTKKTTKKTPSKSSKTKTSATTKKAESKTTKKPTKKKEDTKVPATSKTSGKSDTKKALTKVQKDNFLKGIEQGKFDLVEKHLSKYKVDNNHALITKALAKAKKGKA